MRLASASKVVAAMGIASNDGTLAHAAQALELSYPIVESMLETSFEQQSRTDYFDVIEGELSFRLTNMLVDGETVVVRRSSNGDPLVTAADGDLVDPVEYMVEAGKGVVHFRRRQTPGACLLSVTYESGIAESDTEGELDSPQWLAESSVGVAVHVLNVFPSSLANRKERTTAAIAAEIRHIASQLLNGHKRPRLTVTFPVASTLNE